MNSKIEPRYHVIGDTPGGSNIADQIKKSSKLSKDKSDTGLADMDRLRIEQDRYVKRWHKLQNKYKPKPGQDFCVFVYSLSNKIGSDGLRGLWYIVGTYSDSDDAIKMAKKIRDETGLTVVATETCDILPIKPIIDDSKIFNMSDDEREMGMNNQEILDRDEELRKYDEQMSIKDAINEDRRKGQDKNGIEHYRQEWYDRIMLELEILEIEKTMREKVKERSKKNSYIRSLYNKNPNYEEQLPNNLKNILEQIREDKYINMILEVHKSLQNEIIKITPKLKKEVISNTEKRELESENIEDKNSKE